MGPLGVPVEAVFGRLGNGHTAVIEMAAASGLPLVPPGRRNPLLTTTWGTGQLIKAALELGCREIIIGIGGSATNDAGAGMAQALGAKLLDAEGQEIVRAGGGRLADVARIDVSSLDGRLGETTIRVACDVTKADDVQAAVETAVSKYGAIHGGISCAGTGAAMRTVTKAGPHDILACSRIIEINLIGTFNVIRLAANAMSTNEPGEDGDRGVLINTASVAAFDGQIGQAAYSASKGGIVGMTLPIARDLAGLAIRCVTIAPGLLNTPLLAALPDDVKAALGASVPYPKRLGRPDEYASLAKQIVENNMLNGETIRLDGAIRMAPK